jgi:pyruvate formate lyase activating enzyme
MHEALFYTSEPDGKVRCTLCPHNCLVPDGKRGICKVRFNRDGRLFTNVYGRIAAMHSDPVEKKPLYHFYPGKEILSVGTMGCNLHCSFCQNYSLSQCGNDESTRHIEISPRDIVEKAGKLPGNIGIAYTYNEPAVFFEMVLETSRLAREAGLQNVVVSNGYINQDPLKELLKFSSGFNIDLKAFNDKFYRTITGGHLQPVLDSMKTIHAAGRHLEITLLVIPTLNDDIKEFIAMVDWIASELSPDVPLHLSRYFPSWKMDLPPTPVETLQEFVRIAEKRLHYVYTGNTSNDNFSFTRCPHCRNLLIERHRYMTKVVGLTEDARCNKCKKEIPVVL